MCFVASVSASHSSSELLDLLGDFHAAVHGVIHIITFIMTLYCYMAYVGMTCTSCVQQTGAAGAHYRHHKRMPASAPVLAMNNMHMASHAAGIAMHAFGWSKCFIHVPTGADHWEQCCHQNQQPRSHHKIAGGAVNGVHQNGPCRLVAVPKVSVSLFDPLSMPRSEKLTIANVHRFCALRNLQAELACSINGRLNHCHVSRRNSQLYRAVQTKLAI